MSLSARKGIRLQLEALEDRALPSIALNSAPSWVSKGPTAIAGGQARIDPVNNNGPVAGAISRLAADPTNANILYAGTVNGGVWKTTNALAASPTWTALTDSFSSLSIGALELDPTDATHQTLAAGIGRLSSLGLVGGPRSGLLLSTNG